MNDAPETDAARTAVYAFLTRLAEDPFEEAAYAADPREALARAGLSTDELRFGTPSLDRNGVAGGAWAACQTCSDPGPDPFPEASEARGLR